jgi:hypothetical protein
MTDSARHARVIGVPVLAIWFNVGTMGLAEQANQAQLASALVDSPHEFPTRLAGPT